jgi:hypothetical protein
MKDKVLAQVANIADYCSHKFYSLLFLEGEFPSTGKCYTNRKGTVFRITAIVTHIKRAEKVKVLDVASKVFDCKLVFVSGNATDLVIGSEIWEGELGIAS